MNSPEPQIGFYYAECCLLDLYKIESEDELAKVKARLSKDDEFSGLMVFPTLADAIEELCHPWNSLSPKIEAEEFKRLGWSPEK